MREAKEFLFTFLLICSLCLFSLEARAQRATTEPDTVDLFEYDIKEFEQVPCPAGIIGCTVLHLISKGEKMMNTKLKKKISKEYSCPSILTWMSRKKKENE